MVFLRSLIYMIGQVTSTVIVFALACLAWPFPGKGYQKILLVWPRFNIWLVETVCGLKVEVSGRENLPDEPSIIISNHQSAWETLIFQLLFPAQSYLLKKELLHIPVFGWGLAMNEPVAIDRSKRKEALKLLVDQGGERLADGRWLVIFPEGTRMPPGEPGEFQAGGAMVATRAGCPVVPVAHNAGVFWPKHSFLKYPGTVQLVIGPTIQTEGRKAREVNAEAERWILDTLASLPMAR